MICFLQCVCVVGLRSLSHARQALRLLDEFALTSGRASAVSSNQATVLARRLQYALTQPEEYGEKHNSKLENTTKRRRDTSRARIEITVVCQLCAGLG